MKKFLLGTAISLMAVSMALADGVCPSTNWGDYLALNPSGSCHIGNLDFSGFSYNPAGTIIDPATSVGVSVVTSPNAGFTFNPAITLATPPDGANTTEDVELDFNVTALNGVLIDDLGIFFNGAVTGTGQTSFSETETGATWAGCGSTTCIFSVTNPPVNLGPLEEVFTTPVTSLHIVKDVAVSTGAGPGQASVSMFQNTFSTVPEPRLVSFLMMGLLAVFGASKKFRSVVSR
jgi:hypothetical protein